MTGARGSRLLVIAGPTATGKTEAAVRVAEHVGGELVGADSVQVYRELDVGSAKPTPEQLRGIPHHMIDVIDPDEHIDAMRYAELADAAIERVRARGRVPIVVGGTGLWIRALVRGLVLLPKPDEDIRARLAERADAEGLAAMHARLREVDPRAASQIHPNDRVRILRALEVFEQTGTPMGEHQRRHALGAPRYRTWMAVVDRSKPGLDARIERRTRAMIEAGWADEVRHLIGRWGSGVRPFGTVGYAQMREHVVDGVPLEETAQRIVRATRQYARRQRTWFAGEGYVDWHTDPETLVGPDGLARLERHLH
ncbi:MAG: tRNA (adenosine(37)-N6)-dimethylallyltransferase MiaA [Polyangiales bacterium]